MGVVVVSVGIHVEAGESNMMCQFTLSTGGGGQVNRQGAWWGVSYGPLTSCSEQADYLEKRSVGDPMDLFLHSPPI